MEKALVGCLDDPQVISRRLGIEPEPGGGGGVGGGGIDGGEGVAACRSGAPLRPPVFVVELEDDSDGPW